MFQIDARIEGPKRGWEFAAVFDCTAGEFRRIPETRPSPGNRSWETSNPAFQALARIEPRVKQRTVPAGKDLTRLLAEIRVIAGCRKLVGLGGVESATHGFHTVGIAVTEEAEKVLGFVQSDLNERFGEEEVGESVG